MNHVMVKKRTAKGIASSYEKYLSSLGINGQEEILYSNKIEDVAIFNNLKIDTLQELTIPLNSEIYSNANRDVIVHRFMELLQTKFNQRYNYEESLQMGFIHCRKETGRTDNLNFHAHFLYSDRNLISEKIDYEPKDKIINLCSGKTIKPRDYNSQLINHYKVKAGDPKLNYRYLESQEKSIGLIFRDKNIDIETKYMLKEKILEESKVIYEHGISNRLEKKDHFTILPEIKEITCEVFNEVKLEFKLSYDDYIVADKLSLSEKKKKEKELKEREEILNHRERWLQEQHFVMMQIFNGIELEYISDKELYFDVEELYEDLLNEQAKSYSISD